jgi:hypothetical protein
MILKSRSALLATSLLFASLFLLVVLVDLGYGSTTGGISVCETGCDYAAIQDGISHAQAGDEIKVAPGIYTETLTISQSLALSGEGRGVTVINGNRAGTVVSITAGVRVTITGMRISSGLGQHKGSDSYGGGIYNLGHLSLIDSSVSGNTAAGLQGGGPEDIVTGHAFGGGIYNGCSAKLCATLVLSNTLVRGNAAYGGYGEFTGSLYGGWADGGGLYNDCNNDACGRVTIRKSEITYNSARGGDLGGGAAGGGILNLGIMTMTDTLVDGNSAVDGYEPGPFPPGGSGGGILNYGQLSIKGTAISNNQALGDGGGLSNGGAVQIVNSTISGNWTQYGGGIANGGTVELESVTIYQNSAHSLGRSSGVGGGIASYNGLTIHNSIIAGNYVYGNTLFSAYGPDCYGSLTSQGYNLLGNSADCSLEGLTDGNLVDQPALLNPLGDYGGPTPTHAPWFASPALDAGDPANCLAVDQRGEPRPGDSGNQKHCDIGAVEGDMPPVFTNSMPVILQIR